jgi:hypothetical protein
VKRIARFPKIIRKSHVIHAIVLLSFVAAQFSIAPFSFASPEPVVLPLSHENSIQTGPQVFVDLEKKNFAVFDTSERLDVPSFIGQAEWKEGREQFVATRKIARWNDHYLLTNPSDSEFLQVMERLPRGGFGRLLRHRDQGIDLEFVYDDKSGEVTILDHLQGMFYRIEFKEKAEGPLAVAPSKEEEKRKQELVAISGSSNKWVVVDFGFIGHPALTTHRIHSVNDLRSEQENWLNRKVRGPPEEALPR